MGVSMEPEEACVPPLIVKAERILAERWGGAVRLRWRETFGAGPARKSRVIRCDVAAGTGELPPRCIVKQVIAAWGTPYDPDSTDPRNPAHLLLNDWAALAFLDRVYRGELARRCPEAADDARFRRAMVEAGAHWHILHVVHRLPEALESDRPRGPSTLRQQVLAWIDAFAGLSEAFGSMPALGRAARDLAIRLREFWPAEVHTIPYYAAFDERNAR